MLGRGDRVTSRREGVPGVWTNGLLQLESKERIEIAGILA